MAYFENRGVQFYYRKAGKGIPFIFLHGMGGSTKQVEKLFRPRDTIQMIYLDQRGNGNTELGNVEDLKFDYMADDVIALADYLKLDHFILGGVSMGAAVATRAAIDYNERILGLILIRPAWTHFPMEIEVREQYYCIAQLVEQNVDMKEAEKEYKKWDKYQMIKRISPSVAKSFANHFAEKNIKNNYEKFRLLPEQSPYYNPSKLKQIICPTLILVTKNDFVHKFQYGLYYRDYIPDTTFKEVVSKDKNAKEHQLLIQQIMDVFIHNIIS